MSLHGTSSPTAPGPAGRGSALLSPPEPATPTGRTPRRDQPAAPPPNPLRTRRRSGVISAGVALIAVGSLTAAYLTQIAADTTPVLAVARDVAAGEAVQRADLVVAHVSPDPALSTVDAARLESLLGQRTAIALSAGSLLTDAAVTDSVLPTAGTSVVGVALSAAQLPAEPLRTGDRVRIVDTPVAQGDPPSTTPQTIDGEVSSATGPDETGLTVVDVTVPASRAADLAARVATGRVALVLDSRER